MEGDHRHKHPLKGARPPSPRIVKHWPGVPRLNGKIFCLVFTYIWEEHTTDIAKVPGAPRIQTRPCLNYAEFIMCHFSFVCGLSSVIAMMLYANRDYDNILQTVALRKYCLFV